MLDKFVLGAFFATLNGIGLYQSIPLTGITPTNKVWWRSLSSLEIVWSIHSLRKVHPYVFPEDDAVSNRDVFLQYSTSLEEYENARLALERSIEAGSEYSNIPGVTSATLSPSPTAEPTYIYVDEHSTMERYPQVESYQESLTNMFFFVMLMALLVFNLMMQFFNYATAKSTNQYVEDLHFGIHKQMMNIGLGLGDLQRQIDEFRPVIIWLEHTIRSCTTDMQRCLVHVMGVMEEKYNSSMVVIESKLDQVSETQESLRSKLDEVSETHERLMKNTEKIDQIPKQLAWLNLLIAKTMDDAASEANPNGGPSSNGRPNSSGGPSSNGRPSFNSRPNSSGEPSSNGGPSSNSRPNSSGEPSSNGRPNSSGGPSSNGRPNSNGRSSGPQTPNTDRRVSISHRWKGKHPQP
ncbi:uncharacterized protein N7515_006438 [Penicillium bovifimosum]|uniref:Uncharacterized protein n=1 Tax=Penicillium bovifimosum TaxID=126998 RepID=A0A9W9L0R9_9EURO|nr:uncharacterized protein N7515_006438 [Penicillium bovifimosum]KAJ5130399.1 hypothetical protein N7515_006438 [Penicillium bovifimosum]